ncbi:SH2 domain-containing protein 7 isoform X1 [Oryzias melastigma]|uniref:SH2 domain-containing protein 7 isoform X1 n=1 Tax=Oryzias melastigma TaxID=30732 RepID=UPI00168D929F|nr:SH2 domain-containing protein 7 isoform X1 [Oryzias melastigma]
MEKRLGADLHAEAAEGGLKELVLSWFQETQAPQMMSDGNFPVWFQGLAPRKHAEDLLRDKGVGSFLIRLSDKAIGYILSYKGQDRCRHFVITQNQHGQFMVAGDCELFGSLNELIEHYRVSPIQPFGECLTFSCCEEDAEDLYDMVNVQRKSEVSVQALRKMWQKSESIKKQDYQHQNAPAQTPDLPPKSRPRKLKGTVSVDGLPLSQDASKTPKPDSSLGSTLGETEAHTDEGLANLSTTYHRFKGSTNPMSSRDLGGSMDTSYPATLSPAGDSFSELNHEEGRCHSLPQLNSSTKEEENPSQLDSPSLSKKKFTCQTYSLHAPSTSLLLTQQEFFDEGDLKLNPLYGSCEGSKGTTAQQEADTYEEVPKEPTSAEQPDDTYEPIPREATADHANTYESLQDLKTKTSKPNKQKNVSMGLANASTENCYGQPDSLLVFCL